MKNKNSFIFNFDQMKLFIRKLLLFIMLSAIFIGLTFVSLNSLMRSKAQFTLETPVENVIYGHSHPECAYNDSLISNFKNLAQSRQSYFYSFSKIKNVHKQNPQIKNIFIEFTNNQITQEMDDWTWDDVALSDRIPKYLPFLEKEDLNLLYSKNAESLFYNCSKAFRNQIMNALTLNFDYTTKIGGYRWLESNKTDSLITEYKKNKSTIDGNSQDGLPDKNIEYLEKIVDYCKKKKINIYFIRSPQHRYYPRENENKLLSIKKEKFEDVEFLDFDKFPIKDSDFGDFGHLNYNGATTFSNWFNTLINNGLLTTEHKQEYINNQINRFETVTIN